jgi:hypothetical protein
MNKFQAKFKCMLTYYLFHFSCKKLYFKLFQLVKEIFNTNTEDSSDYVSSDFESANKVLENLVFMKSIFIFCFI